MASTYIFHSSHSSSTFHPNSTSPTNTSLPPTSPTPFIALRSYPHPGLLQPTQPHTASVSRPGTSMPGPKKWNAFKVYAQWSMPLFSRNGTLRRHQRAYATHELLRNIPTCLRMTTPPSWRLGVYIPTGDVNNVVSLHTQYYRLWEQHVLSFGIAGESAARRFEMLQKHKSPGGLRSPTAASHRV